MGGSIVGSAEFLLLCQVFFFDRTEGPVVFWGNSSLWFVLAGAYVTIWSIAIGPEYVSRVLSFLVGAAVAIAGALACVLFRQLNAYWIGDPLSA